MKYILEVYHRGDCLEHRESQEPFIPPDAGERIYVEFENRNISDEYGHWWIVRERKHLFFDHSLKMQTLMLYCEPDPKNGA
ncbi:MAG: hypothetical protein JOZ96_03635 [Acidobacteria bacterium]|nr:hypothetical protein [Acidobacteriota bacterium]